MDACKERSCSIQVGLVDDGSVQCLYGHDERSGVARVISWRRGLDESFQGGCGFCVSFYDPESWLLYLSKIDAIYEG